MKLPISRFQKSKRSTKKSGEALYIRVVVCLFGRLVATLVINASSHSKLCHTDHTRPNDQDDQYDQDDQDDQYDQDDQDVQDDPNGSQ